MSLAVYCFWTLLERNWHLEIATEIVLIQGILFVIIHNFQHFSKHLKKHPTQVCDYPAVDMKGL